MNTACAAIVMTYLLVLSAVSSPACDRDSGELQAKKCKTCPSNALRYHFASLSCGCSEHGVKYDIMDHHHRLQGLLSHSTDACVDDVLKSAITLIFLFILNNIEMRGTCYLSCVLFYNMN